MNTYSLPLFPLNVVVCPDGSLPLKIFEARYLDMVRDCLRNKSSFAIVTILPEGETDPEGNFPFANIGTLVNIVEADVTTVGLMMIRCVGQHRVKVDSFTQKPDGLVIGEVMDIPNDLPMPIPDDLNFSVRVLKQLLNSLIVQNLAPTNLLTVESYQFDNAAWVANRWLEILDLPLVQKQRLMQMESPILRLELIQDFLEENKIV
ncbi:MAG: LON peptidase substrate-binding domain-containing protein [Pseudomonadota bacterium]